jgi:hypothetical protein
MGFNIYYFITNTTQSVDIIPINFYLKFPLELNNNVLTIIDSLNEVEIKMNLKEPLNFLNFLRGIY